MGMFDTVKNAAKGASFLSSVWGKVKHVFSWFTERLKEFGTKIGIIKSEEMPPEAQSLVDQFQTAFKENYDKTDTSNMSDVDKFRANMATFTESYDSVYGNGASSMMFQSPEALQFLTDVYGEEEAPNVQRMLVNPETATEEDIDFLDKMTDAAYGKDVSVMKEMAQDMSEYAAGDKDAFDGDGLTEEEMNAIMADSDEYVADEEGTLESIEESGKDSDVPRPSDTDIDKKWMDEADISTFHQTTSGVWLAENVEYDENDQLYYRLEDGIRSDTIPVTDLEKEHLAISDDDMRKLCGKEETNKDWIKSIDLDRYTLDANGDYICITCGTDGESYYMKDEKGQEKTATREEMIKNHYLIDAKTMSEEKTRRQTQKATERFGDLLEDDGAEQEMERG